jgi:type II secretion system protein N
MLPRHCPCSSKDGCGSTILPSRHARKTNLKNRVFKGVPIRAIIFALIGLLACVWAAWLVIPESMIAAYSQEFLKAHKIPIELSGLKKGLFYTVHIGLVSVSRTSPDGGTTRSQQHPLLCTAEDVTIRPDVSSFLKFSPLFRIRGHVNGGSVTGTYTGLIKPATVHFNGKNIQINGLPILGLMGISGNGSLAFNVQWEKGIGEMRFSIDHADLKGEPWGIRVVPLQLFKRVKGAIAFTDVARLDPISFEGKGVYLRVKGIIRKQSFDGTAEIMMDATFDQLPLFQAALKQYQVSPGYFVIPSHSTS